jgi:uncharacterized protein (DUF1697 family)
MAKQAPLRRYLALLRGINLGNRRVKMDRLRRLFEDLKFADVSTFIASGNVIFAAHEADAAAVERRIEGHLHQSLGYAVATFLRTPAELAAVAAHRPFAAEVAEAAGHSLSVAFLRDALSVEAGEKLLAFRTPVDGFELVGRELYWLCRGKMTDSQVNWTLVAKAVPMASTVRNVTTVRKLAALVPPA